MKKKEDYINELVLICFKIDDNLQLQKEKSERLNRMAQLARQGLKETEEFKILEREFKYPQVIDYSNELSELRCIVKKLKKYKIK